MLTASAKPSVNAYRQARMSGSSSSETSSVPRNAIVTTATSARITRNVTSWTLTTAPGIVARGKRALRTSAPCSSSDGAADSTDWLKKIHTTSPTMRNSG